MACPTTIVLVGGVGSRLRPLSNETPKAMVPVGNRPLLDHLLDLLRRQGFTDIVLTSAGRQGEVQRRYGSGRSRRLRIRYAEPSRWRGTAASAADALAMLRGKVRYPVLVVYGDSLLQVDFRRMVREHVARQAAATILCHTPRFDAFLYDYHDGPSALPRRGPRTNYGIVELGDGDEVLRVEEKPLLRSLRAFRRPAANAAAYVVSEAAWRHVPHHGWCDFPQDLFPRLLAHGLRCSGFDLGRGYRLDLGTLRNYYATQMALLRGRIAVRTGLRRRGERLWVGRGVHCDRDDSLHAPAMVGDETVIAAHARVTGSVLGRGVRVDAGARITASVVLDGSVVGAGAVLSGCILAPGARVPPATRLPPGTVVAPPCERSTFDAGMRAREFEALLFTSPPVAASPAARRRPAPGK